MKGKRYGLLLLLMLAGADICTGQPHRRDVYFGPLADYILINDQSIGDTPVSGLEAGLTVGFRNRGPKSMWGVSLWGAYGFMNIFPSGELNDDSDIIVPIGTFSPSLLSAHLPNYNSRIANRYSGALEGEYLRLVTRPGTRWSVFLGGLFSLQAHYNQILIFSNSEANYFFHAGLAPKVHAEYPFRMGRKEYRLTGAFSYDILAVVARPSYSLPFPGGRMDNVRVASLGGYGMAQTRVGLYHPMRNGNAWEAAYSWRYDFDTHLNRVQQAVHSLSFRLYMNL